MNMDELSEVVRLSGISLSQDATIKLALKGLLEVTEASGKNIEVMVFCLDGFCGWTSQYLTDNDLTSDVLYFNEILYLQNDSMSHILHRSESRWLNSQKVD